MRRRSGQRIIPLILMLAMIMSLLACSDGTNNNNSVGGDQETKTVTDCMKRDVEIPKDPQKVAVLYASTAHMMAMLDEGDKIVATPRGVKSDEIMLMKYPKIADTATPYQENTINVEELVSIGADLALVRRTTAENETETEKLDKLGIPYLVVDYENITELREAIAVMGDVFDKEQQAGDYLNFFDQTIDMVTESIKDVDDSNYPKVYHSVNEAIRTDAGHDICMEIMELAGTDNVAANQNLTSESDKSYTTLEEIYNWNPYAIIANEYSVTDYILEDSKWKGLKAVENKHVYTLPVGATRWCHPGSMEAHMGVLAVANFFHEDALANIEIEEYTKDYYKDYFDLDLDDKTIKKILSGKGMRVSNSPQQ